MPPLKLSDGGVLADGFDEELDELRRLSPMLTSSWSIWNSANAKAAAFPP